MKKGFTLAELLGVIIILGVIALISITAITNTMKENKEELYNIQINSYFLLKMKKKCKKINNMLKRNLNLLKFH